ncbi:MAG: GTP-binding protein [Myxococcota bacterium]
MDSVDPVGQRNIGIVAHIDAGKTTLTEQVLVCGGALRRPGSVEHGSTVTDWLLQEQERGITIGSAAVACRWRDADVVLVDTPGHVDFTVEVERSLTVLDGVVVVLSGPDGVQAQTQTVWHQAARHRLPVIGFVNKLDRPGFDDEALQEDVSERLGIEPLPMQVPVEHGGSRLVLLDVLAEERLVWEGVDRKGAPRAPVREPIEDDEEHLHVTLARERIVDAVASWDDDFAERILEGDVAPVQDWHRAVARATHARACLPLVYGVARAGAGVEAALGAVLRYLPPPTEARHPDVFDLRTGRPVGSWARHRAGEVAAFVFKTERRVRGRRIAWVRVFEGTLEAGAIVRRLPGGETLRVEEAFRLFGGEEEPVSALREGTIGAIVPDDEDALPRTGETLAVGDLAVTFESVRVPTPVISVSVEAEDLEEDARMRRALEEIATDDPSLAVVGDRETGQTLLAGMGELHLELAIERIRREHGVAIRSGPLRPRRRNVLSRAATGHAERHQGTVPHGTVSLTLRLEPGAQGPSDGCRWEAAPPDRREWREATEGGVRHALEHEADVVDAIAIIEAIESHGAGLTPRLFWEAGAAAVRVALSDSGPVPAEPWMALTIVVPEGYVGRVSTDLARRRGRIRGSSSRGGLQILDAAAPLAEVVRYATELRSLTGGRATFSMEPAGYQSVPE